MAIHEDVPGIEVAVRCHEQPLRELGNPNAQDDEDPLVCPAISNYVECMNDTEFDIWIMVSPDYAWGYRDHVLVANVYIDGKHVRGAIFQSQDIHVAMRKPIIVKGVETEDTRAGLWTLSKFKFAAVKTIDDAPKERVEGDLKIAQHLGTIEVTFHRAIKYGPVHFSGSSKTAKAGRFELAEKSLKGKALSHGTSYGGREYVQKPGFVDVRYIEEDNGPILIFKFMYRSKDALRGELIIPRSPSPMFENLTPAERDRLARERLDELREKKVKRENQNPVIKREIKEVLDLTQDRPAPRPTKKTRLESGREVDVIDLTDD